MLPYQPRPPFSLARWKSGHDSIGSRHASWAQLEDAPGGEQVRDGVAGIVADPAREHDPMAALHGRDRVELHAGEPADRRLDAPRRRAPITAGVRGDGPPDRNRFHRRLRHRVPILYVQSVPQRAATAAPGAGAGGRLRPGRADDGARRRGVRASRDRPARAAGDIFRRVRLEDLEDDDGPFDAVVAVLSLHHIRDLGHALDRIVALLSPAGRLILDEFGWDRLDAGTLAWLYEQRRARGDAPGSLDELRTQWDEEHLGLHKYVALRREIDARFEARVRMDAVLAPQAGRPGDRGARAGLVAAGEIQALGFRYAAASGRRAAARRC